MTSMATTTGTAPNEIAESTTLTTAMPTIASMASTTDAFSQCCPIKKVDGVMYKLQEVETSSTITKKLGCKDTCIYIRISDGQLFCFKIGELQVECLAGG